MNSQSNNKSCLLMTKNLKISPVYLSKLWLKACEIHFWAGVEANRSAISSLTIAFARLGNADITLSRDLSSYVNCSLFPANKTYGVCSAIADFIINVGGEHCSTQ